MKHKVTNLLDLHKIASLLKKDRPEIDVNWRIDFKVIFLQKKLLGYDCLYESGYFFWSKRYDEFK